jgi:hypothetical protein
MEISDLIAPGSVVAAILAALYARWSALAAQRTNEIAIHNERLKVYRLVLDFAATVTSRGPNILEEHVWRFNEAVQLSEFYFDKKTHETLEGAFKEALDLLSKNDRWQMKDELLPDQTKDLVKERHAISRKIRDDIFAVADKMKAKLRIGKA